MLHLVHSLRAHPVCTGILGTITSWATVDFLRASQIFAAVFAGLVSLMTAIIIAPKAWAQLRTWCRRA